jgi:hypothetical protein
MEHNTIDEADTGSGEGELHIKILFQIRFSKIFKIKNRGAHWIRVCNTY